MRVVYQSPDLSPLREAAAKFTNLRKIVWECPFGGAIESLKCVLSAVKGPVRILKVSVRYLDRERWTVNDCSRTFQELVKQCNHVEVVDIVFEEGLVDIEYFELLLPPFGSCESLKELYFSRSIDYRQGLRLPGLRLPVVAVQQVFHEAFSTSKIRFANIFGQKYMRYARYA